MFTNILWLFLMENNRNYFYLIHKNVDTIVYIVNAIFFKKIAYIYFILYM